MAMAALSPSSVLASPIQVNPQVKTDLQVSVPQVAEDAQKAAKAAQTDTITISAQALKMADDKNVVAKGAADRLDEQKALQLANNKADTAKDLTQKNAIKAYAALSANQ
jgi:acetyl-CoA acetyltransferase